MPILITYFLLLAARTDEAADHPAEDGIKLSVIMAARLHTKAEFEAVSIRAHSPEELKIYPRRRHSPNVFLIFFNFPAAGSAGSMSWKKAFQIIGNGIQWDA
jgi:hypothetical protein